jgi:hypothetical protein
MKINNERFTIRFCRVMQNLGITTVKQAEKFLGKCTPTMKLMDTSASWLQKELKDFLTSKP